MDSIRVQGGIPLQGKVTIQGSKNAALPILAACLLVEGPVFLENVPRISDVYGMIRILQGLGCQARWEQGLLRIDSERAQMEDIPGELASSMRSSIFLLGALLGRFREARLWRPGGCVIGKRPIDLHRKTLEKIGVRFAEEGDRLSATARDLQPGSVKLEFPSVGATENLILTGALAEGETTLEGAAKEPEVAALCEFLNACGASIEGAGTGKLSIRGGRKLHGTKFRIPADRIVAGTYLLAGFAAGGSMLLKEAPVSDMTAVCDLAERMGASLEALREGIYCQFPQRAGELPFLKTEVHPGFPTDLQSVLLAVRCRGRGSTLIRETIFENRFRIAGELQRMGADLQVLNDREVGVRGVEKLQGTEVVASELRGGAALVVAALGASGETIIRGRRFIDRGYDNICKDLRDLGARIVSG